MFGFDEIGRFLGFFEGKLVHALLSPGSSFSAAANLTALFIAATFLLLRRRAGRRNVSIRLMLRALFPSWLYRTPSFRTDVGLALFNLFGWGVLFGWATLSARTISNNTADVLAQAFGSAPAGGLPASLACVLATVLLFLAWDFCSWLHHYLNHRVPLFWEFHKVHHTAEILTPITNFRLHPFDVLLYYNMIAVALGTTGGLLAFAFGPAADMFALDGTNVIRVVFLFAITPLQHTHVWIPFTGALGRILISPAHHQLHHSTNPIHFNKNLGSSLAVWDWLFGTLQIPTRERERLTFGIEPVQREHHSALGVTLQPLVEVFARALPSGGQTAPAQSSNIPSSRDPLLDGLGALGPRPTSETSQSRL